MRIRLSYFLALGLVVSPMCNAGLASPSRCVDSSRACLEGVARSYIDALLKHDGTGIPLAKNVRRTENALTNAKGADEVRESFVRTKMVERARGIRLYANPAKGEVIALFLLDIDLKASQGAGDTTTKSGKSQYQVSVVKPAGSYTVHEAERFKISHGQIEEIEIIAHVEDGKGLGSGWPVDRAKVLK